MIRLLTFSMLAISLFSHLAFAADETSLVVRKNCRDNPNLVCYKAIAEFDKLAIDDNGNFVVSENRGDVRRPTANMEVKMPQSVIDYFVKYGFPEYASDSRLQNGTLLKVWVLWTVEVIDGIEKHSPQIYQLEVQDQTGRIGSFHLSLWTSQTNRE